MDEIAQGGAPAFDGLGEDCLHPFGQHREAFARDLSGGAQRRDPGGEQRFGRVDVADPDHHRLVHQEALDRGRAAAAGAVQGVAVESVRQRFRPEARQQRVQRARRLPEQAAEPARVVEAQQAAVVECDIDVVMRAYRRALRQHPQAAAHAQVHQRAAGGGIQQQVLGAPAHGIDALAGEPGLDLARNRPAQIRPAQHDARHFAIEQMRHQAAAGGFDFGQLGHARIMPHALSPQAL